MDAPKESKCQYLFHQLMTQCGRAAKVYVVIGMECAVMKSSLVASRVGFWDTLSLVVAITIHPNN